MLSRPLRISSSSFIIKMSLAVASSSSSSISSRSFSEIKAPQLGSFRAPSHVASSQRRRLVKALAAAQPKRSDSVAAVAATAAVVEEEAESVEVEDYEKLAKELESGSPLQIMDKALEKFGNDIAIAFSMDSTRNSQTMNMKVSILIDLVSRGLKGQEFHQKLD